jgi:two-component system, LuxR family, response regulator FixJ
VPSSIRGPMVRRTVLWIDDEVSANDAAVRLLLSEGFVVDCVNSGAAGLAKANGVLFDAVLLDLRLPDMSGLSVLQQLRRSVPYRAPVAVLTGYGDIQSAVLAMKLGAVDFREKPVLGDQLTTLLRLVIAPSFDAHAAGDRRPELPGELREADTPSASLLRALLDLSNESQTADAPCTQQPVDRFAALLLASLVARDLPLRLFLACAEGLRRVLLSKASEGTSEVRQHLVDLIEQVRHSGQDRFHPTVSDCIVKLEANGHRRPTEHTIARELGVDPAHLGRLLKNHTQLGFREWRKGLALRLAVTQLITTEVQIAQIAYRAGFEYPSQFDRDFRGVFGMSPREFRQYSRTIMIL